jgi:hypothetical protein
VSELRVELPFGGLGEAKTIFFSFRLSKKSSAGVATQVLSIQLLSFLFKKMLDRQNIISWPILQNI